jgi:hypothetical protein
MFKLGHGSNAVELLGPSISYFWNDIYDAFDIKREMVVERLDGNTFSIVEIKRLFNDLSEDMEEDFAEIWLEIQNEGKRLNFLEINILPGIGLDEQQQLLEEYLIPIERPVIVDSADNYRLLHFSTEKLIVLLVNTRISETNEKEKVDTAKVKILIDKGRDYNAKRLVLLTWNEIIDEAKSIAKESKVELMDSQKMLKEINVRNLEMALDKFRSDAQEIKDEEFTKEKFRIYLELVKSARSNLAKKDSLEHLSKYFFNGVKGFKVLEENYRGPSEEIDLIIANESNDSPLNTFGNPIAVECRHRRKPASSKDIRDFFGKLESVGFKAGILVSLKGVTGNPYDAVGVIRDARKKGTSIIVITLEELNQVGGGKKPFEIIRNCFYKYV